MLCLIKLFGLVGISLSWPSSRAAALTRCHVGDVSDRHVPIASIYNNVRRKPVRYPLLVTLCCDLMALPPHVPGWCLKSCHLFVPFFCLFG